MNKESKIYGIGNPLVDLIVPVSDKDLTELGIHKGTMTLVDLSRFNQLVEFAEKKDVSYSCGGSCPNTITTLAALGVPAVLAGKVGSDSSGTLWSTRLESLNVQNDLVHTSELPTGSTVIFVTPDSERSMNTYLGANTLYTADDVKETSVAGSSVFHFTGYMWDTENQKQSILKALNTARNNSTKISFDIADPFAVARYRERFIKIIDKYCDICFANSEEARILFDNYDPKECCKSMGKMCETAIVKNGKRGSYICHQRKMYSIPVKGKCDPVDTTGAGDTYAVGFLWGLEHNLPVEDSGLIASILAGEIISQRGAQFSPEKTAALKAELESGDWRER